MTSRKFKLSRFAPSLTGGLHIGNLASLYYASIFGERVVGRVDTPVLDPGTLGRLRSQIRSAFRANLHVERVSLLNLAPPPTVIAKLSDMGVIYKDLSGGRYDGCLRARISHGRKVSWTEANGRVLSSSSSREDPVVVTSKGKALYTLASVIGDYLNGVDLVVRGRDLIPDTPTQIVLFKALGRAPTFLHHGLFLCDHAKLSKSSEGGWKLDSLTGSGYALPSLVRWVRDHSKKFSAQDLTLENISTNDKVVSYGNLSLGLRKDLRNLSLRSLRSQLSHYPEMVRLVDSLGGEGLGNAVRTVSGSILELRRFLKTLEGESIVRGEDLFLPVKVLLRTLLWNSRVSPSLEEGLDLLPRGLIMRRLGDLYRLGESLKSTVAV